MMKDELKKSLDKMQFISITELLLPDSEEAKNIKSIFGREVEYIDFLCPLELLIANYGLQHSKLKDVDVIKALRNIRDYYHNDISFFKDDFEYNLMMTLDASLQLSRKITKHELMLVIGYILWSINNRRWTGDARAYLRWIANFLHVSKDEQKAEFDNLYEEIGKKHGFDKKHIQRLKEGDDEDPPIHEVVLSKLDSEKFAQHSDINEELDEHIDQDGEDEEDEFPDDENSLWSEGVYARTISTSDPDFQERMKYFDEKENALKEHQCKKCKTTIGKHNLYWHEGMCNECFFKERDL